MGSDGPGAHFSASHHGQEEGYLGHLRLTITVRPRTSRCQEDNALTPRPTPRSQTHAPHLYPSVPTRAPRGRQVVGTQPGPWMLTASWHKESPLPCCWVPGAHPMTAPEEGPRNFSPD